MFCANGVIVTHGNDYDRKLGLVPLGDEYTPPERIAWALAGEVYGHPTRPDGDRIITSGIIRAIDPDILLTLSGSCYKLGKPHADYETAFPNAKQRLMQTIISKTHTDHE